jgi:hypothetical protein
MADGVGLLPMMRAGGWKSMNIIGRCVEHAEITVRGQMRNTALPFRSILNVGRLLEPM